MGQALEPVGISSLDADAWSALTVPPATPPRIAARLGDPLKKTAA